MVNSSKFDSNNLDFVSHFDSMRKKAGEVFKSRLVLDANDVHNLDKHIAFFLKNIKSNAANLGKDELRRQASIFEGLIHEEINYLFARTSQDILLFQKTISSLSVFRDELKVLLENDSLNVLAKSELSYANLLAKEASEKLSTLQLLFKKLKKNSI